MRKLTSQSMSFVCPRCGVFAHHKVHPTVYYHDTKEVLWIQEHKISQCAHCYKWLFWENQILVYPVDSPAPPPTEDMPDDVRLDFNEAREVFTASPRASAALLRLSIQKLCKHLGEPGKNINDDIGSLVRKGLSEQIRGALDVVRVVGNNAVHPGEMSIEDVEETALSLFTLVNLIVERMISEPRRISELHQRLPEKALEGIKNRDGK